MSKAQQVAHECTLGRTWPDRRQSNAAQVDLDPTVPARRATDVDEVIRPARDLRPMGNKLTLQLIKAERKRFTGEGLTDFGTFT